ncbi:MAG: hypothetical protein WCC48_07515 [Anaeromyxobacteraceae bacterium]
MEQLGFFAEPPAVDARELQDRIDPQLDAAFLAEVASAFAALTDRARERADVEAA